VRAPYLIERVEASALAAASQVACQRHHRLPEQGISHSWRGIEVVLGVPKIGVVEDVEEIPSGLKRKPLCQFELPPERQIDLCSAESAQGISTQTNGCIEGEPLRSKPTENLSRRFASDTALTFIITNPL